MRPESKNSGILHILYQQEYKKIVFGQNSTKILKKVLSHLYFPSKIFLFVLFLGNRRDRKIQNSTKSVQMVGQLQSELTTSMS